MPQADQNVLSRLEGRSESAFSLFFLFLMQSAFSFRQRLVLWCGASIGTSLVVAVLVRTSQVNYIELRKHINPYRELFLPEDTIVGLDAGSPSGILSFYHLVGEQAQMIGFLNSFYFSVAVVFLAIPLLLFLKTPQRQT